MYTNIVIVWNTPLTTVSTELFSSKLQKDHFEPAKIVRQKILSISQVFTFINYCYLRL